VADNCPVCGQPRCDPLQHAVDEHNEDLADAIREIRERTVDPDDWTG
jgi:hypothetical protein